MWKQRTSASCCTLQNKVWLGSHKTIDSFSIELHHLVQYFQLSGGRAPGRSSPSNFSSHHLWFSHAGFLYVDDFLFFMEANMMPVSAALVCIMCQLLGIPISWRKTALSSCIDYIGWQFNFFTGIVSMPVQKIHKLRDYISHLHRSSCGLCRRSL